MDKPKNLIKIRDIKDILTKGTKVKYQHGDFAKRLFVEGSRLLSSEYYDSNIIGSSLFSSFVGGNLRQLSNDKWGYAIARGTERLERLNFEYEDEYDDCYIYVCFYNAFQNNILPDLKKKISVEADYDAYLMLVYKKISELVKKDNTYYLELYNDISKMIERNELHKVLALLCMISIFQDKICLFFPDKYRTRWSECGFFPHSSDIQGFQNTVLKKSVIPLETNAMFKVALSGDSELGKISEIDMAFHSGSDWQRDSDKVDFLRKAIEAKVKIRIIVNTDLIKEVCSHMTQPGRRYVGFDEGALEWIELSRKHPDLLEVHVAKVPLLHRTYIIRNRSEQGWVNIKYYTYGNYLPDKDQRICFDNTDRSYSLYVEEFEYLWKNASFKYTNISYIMDSPSEALKKMSSEGYCSSSDILCGILNDGNNGFRDVDKSSKLFDPDKSLEDLLEKADQGDEKAMTCVGIYYFHGISCGRDERKAAEWFKKVSDLNGECAPIADKFIARLYYSGSMPREEQSYEKSYEYHVKSAIGDIYSAGQVGFMQSIGSGCPFDYKKTEEYFLQMLDHLDNPRKDTLCRFYLSYGEFKKAADIYVKMAESYPEAAYQLGLLYKRGVLSKPFMPDYSKAAFYLQMAVDNGYLTAAYELGTLYFNPAGSFKKDFQKAHKYYHIAAENGSAEAQYMLGYMYYYGHIEKNIHKSLAYHKMAAKQGHVLSAAHLAILYQIPEIHNYEKAFYYAKYAAECGDAPSEFVLGTLYLSGRGCEPDADKAYLCFKHAAENGAPEAKLFLMQMDEMGI